MNRVIAQAMFWLGRVYLSDFPIDKGKWRLWKKLDRFLYEEPLPPTVRRLADGNLINLDPSQAVDRFIYFWNRWEPNETWLLQRLLGPGDTFVDVGANIGYFTLTAARLVGPTGRVAAIEATPPTVERLRANIALNGYQNITVHACAATDQAGTVRINRMHRRNAGMNSIRPRSGRGPAESWDVPAVRLDELLPQQPIRLVKMDIEGAEMLALRGLRQRLTEAARPDLLLEICPEYLAALGFDHREIFRFTEHLGYTAVEVGDRRLLPLSQRDIEAGRVMTVYFRRAANQPSAKA